MAAVQLQETLRIADLCGTVIEPVVLVIAGVTPIDLLAQEKKRI